MNILKRFKNWWDSGKKTSEVLLEDTSEVTEDIIKSTAEEIVEGVAEKILDDSIEEDFVYKTTILDDLNKIERMLKLPDYFTVIMDFSGLYTIKFMDRFDNSYLAVREMEESLAFDLFDRFRKVSLYENNVTPLHATYSTHELFISKEDYYSIYQFDEKLEESLSSCIALIENNLENPQYFYLFIKYEASIALILSVVEDSIDYLRKVPLAVQDEVLTVVEKLETALLELKKAEEEIKQLQEEETVQSLVRAVKTEISYMDEYIESKQT